MGFSSSFQAASAGAQASSYLSGLRTKQEWQEWPIGKLTGQTVLIVDYMYLDLLHLQSDLYTNGCR